MPSTESKREDQRNLKPARLNLERLDPANPLEYLETIRDFVEEHALEAIQWYLRRKGPVSLWSKVLRFSALVLASIGAILPLLRAPVLPGFGDAASEFGYAFLALSGALVVGDKLFGLSSKWMRYMTTALSLQRKLADFELRWATRRLLLGGGSPPGPAEIAEMIEMLRQFRHDVFAELQFETDTWKQEFQSSLRQLEAQAKLDHASTPAAAAAGSGKPSPQGRR